MFVEQSAESSGQQRSECICAAVVEMSKLKHE